MDHCRFTGDNPSDCAFLRSLQLGQTGVNEYYAAGQEHPCILEKLLFCCC